MLKQLMLRSSDGFAVTADVPKGTYAGTVHCSSTRHTRIDHYMTSLVHLLLIHGRYPSNNSLTSYFYYAITTRVP